jgi:ribosomal protein S18 acetylase RimI-like enzyme
MTPGIMVRWVPAESWAEVANEAWHVLHDAGLGVKQVSFVRAYPDDGVAVAETAAGEIVGVLTLMVRPEGYNERFAAFHGLPGPRALINQIGVAKPMRCQGVGRMLMRAAAEEVRSRGGQRVALMVDWSTKQADRVGFFRACGLWSLRKDRDDDLLGAEVNEILAATATDG